MGIKVPVPQKYKYSASVSVFWSFWPLDRRYSAVDVFTGVYVCSIFSVDVTHVTVSDLDLNVLVPAAFQTAVTSQRHWIAQDAVSRLLSVCLTASLCVRVLLYVLAPRRECCWLSSRPKEQTKQDKLYEMMKRRPHGVFSTNRFVVLLSLPKYVRLGVYTKLPEEQINVWNIEYLIVICSKQFRGWEGLKAR